MTRPWLISPTGPRADMAAQIAAPVPVIGTARLRLRAPMLADFPAYEAIICADGGAAFGEAMTPSDAWLDFCELVAGWMLRGHGLFAVEARDDDRLIGFVTLDHEQGDPEPELGWFLLPEARGHGFATEAAAAIRDFAFDSLQMPALVSYTDPGNAASIAVARRLGAMPEGMVQGAASFRHRKGGAA